MGTEVNLPLGLIFGFLLVAARVGGAFLFVPLPGIRSGPDPVRAALAAGYTLALYPLWPASLAAEPSLGRMAAWMAAEATLGIAIGVAVAFLLEILLVGAQLLGLQAGYGYASTVDPTTQADSSVLLVVSQLFAGLLFFALGVDREVLRAFAGSLETIPPGSYRATTAAADALIHLGGAMFSTGLRLALPVIVLLLLVDVALALLSRIQQQMQLLTLAFPLKMLAALAFLAALATLYLPVWRAAAAQTVSTFARLL
jgi:flagellar biosynthesis protein FliR